MIIKRILIFLVTAISFQTKAQNFITRWDLSLQGNLPTELSFPIVTTGVVNYTWQTVPAGTSGSGTFNGNTAIVNGIPTNATIRLEIDTTNFRGVKMLSVDGDRLVDIEQWGVVKWGDMDSSFQFCRNLNVSATDVPDLSNCTTLKNMFLGCYALTGPSNINSWTTSTILDMDGLFYYDSLFNQPLNNWDVSNVTSMRSMFARASIFNQPLDNWNTGNVIDMNSMFRLAKSFNQNINSWNTSNVIDMRGMFYFAKSFNQPLDNWNTTNVTSMAQMFYDASKFNQPLSTWNTSNVTNMSFMFASDTAFDQPIGNWNTNSVVDMSYMFASDTSFNQALETWNTSNVLYSDYMFYKATKFNQPLNTWNTSKNTYMKGMFLEATAFNRPLNNWNVSNVTDMRYMFNKASAFNQNIGSWVIDSMVHMENMLDSCGMDCYNYSGTLNAWSVNPLTASNIVLGCSNMKCGSTGTVARTNLDLNKNWNFVGDLVDSLTCYPTATQTILSFNTISQCIPNPASQYTSIQIHSDKIQLLVLTIFNSIGQIVFTKTTELQKGISIIKIPTSHVDTGFYFTHLTLNNEKVIRKFVVEN